MIRNPSPVLRGYRFTRHRALAKAKHSDLVSILELTTRALVLASEADLTVLMPEADDAGLDRSACGGEDRTLAYRRGDRLAEG